MRNPKRIYPIMDEVTKYWSKRPDQRFGQMISNLLGDLCTLDKSINDIWFPEDNKWLELLKKINEEGN